MRGRRVRRWVALVVAVGLGGPLSVASPGAAQVAEAFDVRLDPVQNVDRYTDPGDTFVNLWMCITEPAYVEIEVFDAQGAHVRTLWNEHFRSNPLCSEGFAAPQWNLTDDLGQGVPFGAYTVVIRGRTEAGESDVESVQIGVERQQFLARIQSPPSGSTVRGVSEMVVAPLGDRFSTVYDLQDVRISCQGTIIGSSSAADDEGRVTVLADTSMCNTGQNLMTCALVYTDPFGAVHDTGWCLGVSLDVRPPLPSDFVVDFVENISFAEEYHFRYGQPGRLVVCLSRPATVDVEVLDEAGDVVRTLAAGEVVDASNCELQVGASAYLWYYDDDAGQPVPDGDYEVRVRATDRSGADPVPATASLSATWHVTGQVPGTFTAPTPGSVFSGGIQSYTFVRDADFVGDFPIGALVVGCAFTFDLAPPGTGPITGTWNADACGVGGVVLPAAVLFIDPVGRIHTYNAPIPITITRPTVEPGVGFGTEGDDGSTTIDVPVDLTYPVDEVVTAAWSVTGGSATAGSDFDVASGTIEFQPGETRQHVSVTIHGDDAPEFDEMVVVRVGSVAGARLGGFWGLGFAVIEDDDAGPRVRPGEGEAVEGVDGQLHIPLTLSEPSSETVRVTWRTADHSAAANADYVPATGIAEFAPGQTTSTVTIDLLDDTVSEPDQIVILVLQTAEHASIGGWLGLGFGRIVDDD